MQQHAQVVDRMERGVGVIALQRPLSSLEKNTAKERLGEAELALRLRRPPLNANSRERGRVIGPQSPLPFPRERDERRSRPRLNLPKSFQQHARVADRMERARMIAPQSPLTSLESAPKAHICFPELASLRFHIQEGRCRTRCPASARFRRPRSRARPSRDGAQSQPTSVQG